LAVAGGASGERSGFPLGESSGDYASMAGSYLAGVTGRPREVIRSLQPFGFRVLGATGIDESSERDPLETNLYLMLVGRLDNIDKHRLILPAEILVPWAPPTFTGVASVDVVPAGAWVSAREGEDWFRLRNVRLLPGAGQPGIDNPHAYTIGFGDRQFGPIGQPNDLWLDRSKGYATKADLGRIAEHVERVIGLLVNASRDR
jgi:hypothetical protein